MNSCKDTSCATATPIWGLQQLPTKKFRPSFGEKHSHWLVSISESVAVWVRNKDMATDWLGAKAHAGFSRKTVVTVPFVAIVTVACVWMLLWLLPVRARSVTDKYLRHEKDNLQ